MNSNEFRANAAGYLDGATVLVRTVVEALKHGETMKDAVGRQKIACPPPVYEVLMDAEKALQKVAGWLLDPNNAELEK